MNYTIHQLQIFLEVVRLKSITQAAHEMHMTQPALSVQLKNFQNQFNIPLTEKIGRNLHITEFGLEIAKLAENVLTEMETIKYKTKEYNGLISGKLRISSASSGKYVIPYFLSGFLENHSGVDLTLGVSNKIQVLKQLKTNEIDFALVSVLPNDLNVNEEVLLENRLYLIGNTPDFDNNKPLIFREDGSATRVAMDKYFASRDIRKSISLTSNEAVKQAVVAGLGYSILPLIGIENELRNKQLHIIASKNLPITNNWRLIWLKSKRLSPSAEAYLEYIRENKYTIINTRFKWYFDYLSKKAS